jgi:hypothetical protein
MVTKTASRIGVGLAVVLALVPLAGGASFTLSDEALMSLDWNLQDYYGNPVKARILERRDIPGWGVEFDIFYPGATGLDSTFYAISSSRGGSGSLVGLDVSPYAKYELMITLKYINGRRSMNAGDRVIVGAIIGPFGSSRYGFRPYSIDLNSSTSDPECVQAYTDVKTAQLSLVGFTAYLFPFENNHWNPSGTTLTLLVQPASGAVQLYPKPRQVKLEQFARFAAAWMRTECIWPGRCGGGDLNEDGVVNGEDLLLFATYWLNEMPVGWGL